MTNKSNYQIEFGVNTNLSNNFSTQTDPRSFTSITTNTTHPPQTSTQTDPRIFSNLSTNTPHPIQTSTQTDPRNNVEDCQCETKEINQPLIPFQSNFARQLHQNEVMRQNLVNGNFFLNVTRKNIIVKLKNGAMGTIIRE